jgi:hypothetical protein
MDLTSTSFRKNMSFQSIIFAIILFGVSIYCHCYNISFFGIDSFYYALISSVIGGLELIIAFDYHANGAIERPFGILPLYLIGMVLGAIIFYLVISNISLDLITQIQTILQIEAVR